MMYTIIVGIIVIVLLAAGTYGVWHAEKELFGPEIREDNNVEGQD